MSRFVAVAEAMRVMWCRFAETTKWKGWLSPFKRRRLLTALYGFRVMDDDNAIISS